MSILKVQDIAFVRFSAPDLDAMRAFQTSFGLVASPPWHDGVLRMRGAGPSPYIHVTEKGPAAFLGVGLYARNRADLERLARAEGGEITPLDAPGGGFRLRLVDPNGFEVDIVAEQSAAAPLEAVANAPWNFAAQRLRQGAVKRVAAGPSVVERLGHAVMLVDDLDVTWRWWSERFGLLVSDSVIDPKARPAALFVRCDRGDAPADHHTLNFSHVPGKRAQFHHVAFEVADLDSLMAGHDYLAALGERHIWGIGRHILGSQVFDYWEDPFGNRVEHWTDGDLLPAHVAAGVHGLDTMVGSQWGPAIPEGFV